MEWSGAVLSGVSASLSPAPQHHVYIFLASFTAHFCPDAHCFCLYYFHQPSTTRLYFREVDVKCIKNHDFLFSFFRRSDLPWPTTTTLRRCRIFLSGSNVAEFSGPCGCFRALGCLGISQCCRALSGGRGFRTPQL